MATGKPKAVLLADVARAAGVGTSIVSRVLNSDPTVSIRKETRERILAAARELNYRPNALARGLRLARTMTIGIIINLAYYHEIAESLVAVERAAGAAGYMILIADAKDFVGRGEAYRRLLFERRVDGMLIGSTLVTDDFIRELDAEGLPFLILNRRVRGVGPSTSGDDALGMRMAVQHLVELGHQRIGYLGGPVRLDPATRRLEGFRKGMREAGLRIQSGLIVESSLDDEDVFRATKDLLGLNPRPTSMVVWSATGAVPALAAARRAGLRLPDELSVVAFNDSTIADYLDPPLTTIRMPHEEISRVAVESLLRIIEGGHPRNVVVHTPPVLVERGSTQPSADA